MDNSVNKFCSKYSSFGTFKVELFHSDSLSKRIFYVFLLLVKLSMTFFIQKILKVSGSFLFNQDLRYCSLFFLDSVHASFWVFSLDLKKYFLFLQSVECCFKGLQTFQHSCFEIYFSKQFCFCLILKITLFSVLE